MMKTPPKIVVLCLVSLCTTLPLLALTNNHNEVAGSSAISNLFLEYAKNGKTASMQQLVLAVGSGLDINVRGEGGYTALMFAILLKDITMVRFLLTQSDLNLDVTDNLGRTARDIAQKHADRFGNDVSLKILQLFEDRENGVLEVVGDLGEDEEILNLVQSPEFDPNTWPPSFPNIFWGLGDY